MIYSETIKLRIKPQNLSDITNQIEEIVRRSEIKDGVCTIFALGSTSAILINENEPMLIQDIKDSLEKIAPKNEIYHHTENAYSHIKSAILGNSQSIPIKECKLLLGTWQSIMVANFDIDDREREISVTVVGE